MISLFSVLAFGFYVLKPATQDFRKTLEIDSGTLEVYNANGSVEIRGWSKNVVDIQATKKTSHGQDELDKVDIVVTTKDGIVVRTERENNARVSVNFMIRVPQGVAVRYVENSNGGILLEETKGNSSLNTSNGEIVVRDVDGYLEANTSNGKIDIKGTRGIRDVSTSNGSVRVEIPKIDDDVDISTSNGSVDLYLDKDLDANLDLRTSNGKISVHDLEVMMSNSSSTRFKGKMGKGGSMVQVSTSNGSIDLYAN